MKTAALVSSLAASLIGAGLFACGEDAATAPNKPAGSSGGTFGGTDGGRGDECSDSTKLVYVLSLEGDLHSFAPADKKFTKVGKVACPSPIEIRPVAMGVDRAGIAWINMVDAKSENALFKLDTTTLECTATAVRGGMGGAGFSTNGATTEETLFVTGLGTKPANPGLKKIDFAQGAIVPIGDVPVEAELDLTGTGDGRLYGFVSSEPPALAVLDKQSGAITESTPLPTLTRALNTLFAFAFWGGDFYFFTAEGLGPDKTSNVGRLAPGGALDPTYMTAIGFHIVGAGVSTCAPVALPK